VGRRAWQWVVLMFRLALTLQEWPEMVGCAFGETHFRFPDAIPIGIKKKDSPPSAIIINPSDYDIIEEGDQILVLAEDDDSYAPAPRQQLTREYSVRVKSPKVQHVQAPPERLLFVNWRR